jgi:hypothetical protein
VVRWGAATRGRVGLAVGRPEKVAVEPRRDSRRREGVQTAAGEGARS